MSTTVHPQGTSVFNEDEVLHQLHHYLPAQAPLKDFIHHNTLHAFQHLPYSAALKQASEIFGYKVYLSLEEYRSYYQSGRINAKVLDRVISNRKGTENLGVWKNRLIGTSYPLNEAMRIGSLRSNWRSHYAIDMDSLVHPVLFRILCNYLDQGVAIWKFPLGHLGLLSAIRELEGYAVRGFFKSKRVKELLKGSCDLRSLLTLLVGKEEWFATYLFDLQFSHQGWSGMVAAIENDPATLLDKRKMKLKDFIALELLFEIDVLDQKFGTDWKPIAELADPADYNLFAPTPFTELDEVIMLWQDAFEWSYYDQILAGLLHAPAAAKEEPVESFQAVFCIDDRECSFRRYLEAEDPSCATFGTAGFFGVEFYYQPEDGKHYTKVCPAPVTPKYLVKEHQSRGVREKDAHFSKHAHSLHSGWLVSQTVGFWSALKLFVDIFRPSTTPAAASSLKHMDRFSKLTVEHNSEQQLESGLQVGFTVDEMTDRVEATLKSIGLVSHFAPVVYIIGHGASSVNNPHYAAYDCGACSGRAGSVNARVFSHMANKPEVRAQLALRGIEIAASTKFVGGLQDTTRDELVFFDEDALSHAQSIVHSKNKKAFENALQLNAKERSRRFALMKTKDSLSKIHERVKLRSVSLFEPRPELNHATNAMCIVGRRAITKKLFLDRRAFLNSFDYRVDPTGKYLLNILNAVAPVCGGINLEYYFSRVDSQKLGAGSKLPHNVMGLFGVANGIDGDLRPGLPTQMTEVHEPVRLLLVVEHHLDVVDKTMRINPATFEWIQNNWIHLVVIEPESRKLWEYNGETFASYVPLTVETRLEENVNALVESTEDNIPVCLIH